MKRKIILIGACIALVGTLIAVVGFAMGGFNIEMINTRKFVTTEYPIDADFDSIAVNSNVAGLKLLPSEDGVAKAVCYLDEKIRYDVRVEDGKLLMKEIDERKWYEQIGISWGNQTVTLYLPKSEYDSLSFESNVGSLNMGEEFSFGDVTVNSDTGYLLSSSRITGMLDVSMDTGAINVSDAQPSKVTLESDTGSIILKDVNASGNIAVECDTGKVSFTNVACKDLTVEYATGAVEMKNTVCAGKAEIDGATGSISLDRFDAAKIDVEITTGSVYMLLLSEKKVHASSSTGNVNAQNPGVGGECRVSTSTGSIDVRFAD